MTDPGPLLTELQESIGTMLLTLDRDAPWAVIRVAAINLEERCKRVTEADIPDSTIIRGGEQ